MRRLVESFFGVVRPDLPPVRLGEPGEGEYVGAGPVEVISCWCPYLVRLGGRPHGGAAPRTGSAYAAFVIDAFSRCGSSAVPVEVFQVEGEDFGCSGGFDRYTE